MLFRSPNSGQPHTQTHLLDIKINFLQICVSDTGVGINPEDRDRIFSIFEQEDMSSKRMFNGTGMGLAMSRKLVGLHKGLIWVESEGKDKGSLFTFVIPLLLDS